MSIFEQEKNLLPGVTTEVELDFNEDFDTSLWNTTESAVIIGTAFDGPVNKPVRLYSPEYAKYVFGEAYDHKTRKEATLIKEYLDAWDKGCRTIWGVRISGKPMHRDFQLASTDEYKLRVSAMFPSNSNKNCYFTYDNTYNQNKITIYKPNSRTTMEEKTRGLSDLSKPMIKFDIDLANYELTSNKKLTDLIQRFNRQRRNNVLRLAIVDKNGDDVTSRADLTGDILIDSMFPGAYFIGRDTNKVYATTNMKYRLEKDEDEFGNAKGITKKELFLNTDINKDLPIYAEDLKSLNIHFAKKGLIMTTMFDFLENHRTVDKIYGKDKIDYEEVDLTDFELYKKLGSGYATTAKAEFRKGDGGDIKVIETPVDDPKHVIAIKDGVYSTLENLDTDYRVLAGAHADAIIRDRMPRKDDFKVAIPMNKVILNKKVEVQSKIDKKDLISPKKYSFEIDAFDPSEDITNEVFDENKLYGEKTISHLPYVYEKSEEDLEKNEKIASLKEGDLFVNFTNPNRKSARLYRKNEKSFVPINKIEMKDKLIFSSNKILIGTEVGLNEEEEKSVFFLEAEEGKSFGKEPKFMVAGLMNKEGTAQKKATIDEVVEFFKKPQAIYKLDENGKPALDKEGKAIKIGERKPVSFKKENLEITKNTVEIKGPLFLKKDWDEIKSSPNANKDLPYKITLLYESEKEEEKDKACKIVMYRDSTEIEPLGVTAKEKENDIDKAEKFAQIAKLNGLENSKDLKFKDIKEVQSEDEDTEVIFKEMDLDKFDDQYKFFIVNSGKGVNVYMRDKEDLVPFGSMKDIISDDEDKTLITIEDIPTLEEDAVNRVTIKSSAFDYTTLDDLLEMLNDHPSLRDKFEFTLTNRGAIVKDAYIVNDFEEKESEVFEQNLPIKDIFVDRDVSYDVNTYVPFKTSDNFARQLAQHCLITSLKTGDTHGVIGVKPITNTDLDSVAKRTKELLEKEYDLYAKRDNGRTLLSSTSDEPYSIGDKISIVAHQYPISTGSGYTTMSNGAAGYVGMASSLPLDSSSTNQTIAIEMLSYEYSNYQLANLTQKGYVTFKDSYKKGIVVTDGVTSAPIVSPLRRLSSVKILKAVKDLIRTEAEPYIGKRNNLFNVASLETAIESKMSQLKGVLLEDYEFHIDASKSKAKLGILDIFFTIIPYNEIRNINAKIKVSDEIGITQQTKAIS